MVKTSFLYAFSLSSAFIALCMVPIQFKHILKNDIFPQPVLKMKLIFVDRRRFDLLNRMYILCIERQIALKFLLQHL